MAKKLFKFYPPKKEKNPLLLPDSTLLKSSNLSPLSKNAKKRKFKGAKNTKPAFGPVNAPAMASALAIIPGPSVGGYGFSAYGALPYGESDSSKKRTIVESEIVDTTEIIKKDEKSKDYVVYNDYKNLFDSAKF